MTHAISSKQAAALGQLIAAHNAAQLALQQYFSAVADGLGLPEGTKLIRVEGESIVVEHA